MNDVTVILNVWKRKNLTEQLTSLLNQTVKPDNIWVLHYENHVKVPDLGRQAGNIEIIKSSMNLKYFGRFTLALHSNSYFTWVLDDDIIPSNAWVAKCIETCNRLNSIVVSNGRLIPPGNYKPEVVTSRDHFDNYFIGDSRGFNSVNLCAADTSVAYGCSSFFFKTEWLRHFWHIWPSTFSTGEDIHLSASCRVLAGIRTVVASQNSPEESGNLKPAYSADLYASWKSPEFVPARENIFKKWIDERGWRPLLWNNTGTV